MKWFKHMTASADDEKLARLLDQKNGLALYGAFWRVQEIIAAQIPSGSQNSSVTYSVTRWSLLMSVRGSHVRHYLGQLAKNDLLTVNWNDSDITVTSRNLLKYRDEYARKSIHAPDKLPARTELDGDGDGESTKTIAESDEKPVATPLEETVFDLPCTSNQTYQLPESLYASMVKAYPGISVMAELERARVWLLANRTHMKTIKGVPRFLNAWMSRAQNGFHMNGHKPVVNNAARFKQVSLL